MSFGLLPFEQLKVFLSEEDYASSVIEWNKPSKNKKWYHRTAEAFLNLMYDVSISYAEINESELISRS